MNDVLVIGAGWSGLVAASRLAGRGWSVVVVEKSRGPGGRSATRREGRFAFDHGAQYLTARSESFRRQVRAWSSAGLLAPWRPRLTVIGARPDDAGSRPQERWVGVPAMNAVPSRLAAGVECRFRLRIAEVIGTRAGWTASTDDGEILNARALLITAPPEQTAGLLGASDAMTDGLAAARMQPCWTLMLGYERAPEVAWDAAFVNTGPLAWIARNESKPGRTSGPSWTVHARSDWSADHLEADAESVARRLHEALSELDPSFAQGVALARVHRWRFARAARPLTDNILADDHRRLVVAGDWCAGDRIEGAWVSGIAAARRIAAQLG